MAPRTYGRADCPSYVLPRTISYFYSGTNSGIRMQHVARSATPPKAAMRICNIALLNHFVSPGKYCRRNCEAQCRSSLEIDNKFVLVRCLHWQVSRVLSPENAIDIAGRLPELANQVRAVRD